MLIKLNNIELRSLKATLFVPAEGSASPLLSPARLRRRARGGEIGRGGRGRGAKTSAYGISGNGLSRCCSFSKTRLNNIPSSVRRLTPISDVIESEGWLNPSSTPSGGQGRGQDLRSSLRNEQVFGVARAVASPHPPAPSLKSGLFGGAAGKYPKPASDEAKRTKERFSLRQRSRRNEKRSSFRAAEAAGAPMRRGWGQKPKLREGVPPENVTASAAKQAAGEGWEAWRPALHWQVHKS